MREIAKRAIEELVERFHRNLGVYKGPGYNETQVRREFIDPFFDALGWDVANRAGYAEQYKDVVHEDSVKVGVSLKAPDYSFRIGGQRKFFLEAKRPSVSIKDDISPAYQLRRYAWSAKLPLSILTDFEELAIYDCRLRPAPKDKVSTGRIAYYTYDNYIENFDGIYDVFSKDAVLKGSFDRYILSSKKKRGTGEVDKEFLKEIESWRESLARVLARRNRGLTIYELNFAVQHTIDRIIFLRICEDRGIENYGRLLSIINGPNVYPRLLQLFEEADTRYNSGLFNFKADTLSRTLTIDDKVLKVIIENLYYPNSPYEFSVLGVDILGNVYEQFLGKVIRLTRGHQAKVEEKPEVKKAGGVYYTPRYIVEYIVKNTLGKLLEGLTPKKVSKLKILDPACGSGSFLLGAYEYLLDWHLKWYLENNPEKYAKGKRPALYLGKGNVWRLTTQEKKEILLNNIHGVDIDRQAVEVTKLSLLLKVLEDENQETLGKTLSLFKERALPDLKNNIKCGNSLIGPDFYDQMELDLGDDEIRRINVFDWYDEKRGFGEIMRAGGFDCVIGNPPYVRIQRINHQESDYLFKYYESPTSKTDLSLLFLEKSLQLLNKSGLGGFICTSQWLTTDYGRNLRRMLSDGRLHEIVDFASLPVFQNADTYPAIFLLSPSVRTQMRLKKIRKIKTLSLSGIESTDVTLISLTKLTEKPWQMGGLDIVEVLTINGYKWSHLKEMGKAYIGTLTGMDAAFVVSLETAQALSLENDLLYPYAYRGAEIKRYSEVVPNARVIYPYRESSDGALCLILENELKTSYPNIYNHILSFKSALQKRKDSRKYYAQGKDWYRHLRAGSFKYIHPKKLLFKGIGTSSLSVLTTSLIFEGHFPCD